MEASQPILVDRSDSLLLHGTEGRLACLGHQSEYCIRFFYTAQGFQQNGDCKQDSVKAIILGFHIQENLPHHAWLFHLWNRSALERKRLGSLAFCAKTCRFQGADRSACKKPLFVSHDLLTVPGWHSFFSQGCRRSSTYHSVCEWSAQPSQASTQP